MSLFKPWSVDRKGRGFSFMGFQESLNVYNKKVVKAIASRTMTYELLEELYGDLEGLFQKEVMSSLKEVGVLQKINQRQKYLSDYWDQISDYDLNLKGGYVIVQLDNGDNIKARLGSLRKIVSETMDLSETHKLFFLTMGYLYVNAIDSVCISRAIEARMDEEV